MGVTVALPYIDPQPGVHRYGRPSWMHESGATLRLPSEQEPRVNDAGYPHKGDATPSAYAQGHWRGPGMGRSDISDLNYGDTPDRIPHLWKDATRFWDGLMQRGFTQQNYREQWPHFRPAYPTRGYRSISGVLTSTGPTGSRMRIPAVIAPSAGA